MANLNIPLIRTTQEIPDDLDSFKKDTQLINWSTANVEDVPTNIRFHYSATGGTTSALTWDRTLSCGFEEGKNNLWAVSNREDEIRVNINTGTELKCHRYLLINASLSIKLKLFTNRWVHHYSHAIWFLRHLRMTAQTIRLL